MSDAEKKILKVLEIAKPYLQIDGGDLEFIRFDKETGYVYIKLHGSCEECPLSTMTIQAGIQSLLKKETDFVTRVMQVH